MIMTGTRTGRLSPNRNILLLSLGLSVCSGFAYLGSSVMPFQIDALMTGLHQSASRASLFGFFEIMSFAVFMIVLSRLHLRLPVIVSAFLGAALAVISSLLIASGTTSSIWLWGCAIVFGLAEALLGRSFVCAASASDNPDRFYAIANGGGQLVLVAVIDAIPYATQIFGALGVFVGLAGIVICLTPFMLTLRHVPMAPPPSRHGGTVSFTPGAIALLCIWVGSSLGSSIIWSFAETVGRSLNLSANYIVLLSTLCILSSVGVSFLFGSLADRLRRDVFLTLTLLGVGIGGLLACSAGNAWIYTTGVIIYWNCSMLSYAWLLGSAATLDHTGRVGTFCGGMDRMGYALGAPIGGLIVDHASFTTLGIAGFVACVISMPIGLPILFREIRQHQREDMTQNRIVQVTPV
ncbi:hypothetical protein GLUCOINTEAF2_0203114 [Komagataeibacter intermedius AF2]|uniref:MFS transporter n=3 Tax=Komagataeibacter intermedius TaxID=66229 RepID=A0A0N1N481_9PROT|nr:hypothetical protein GLUCOINTEAF2_0203114 [Komagataeibacter intermedius AF2]GBQ69773.1 hypothetical protein AA0521_1542 [Komagataeibacter intermedius NRIC 0521]